MPGAVWVPRKLRSHEALTATKYLQRHGRVTCSLNGATLRLRGLRSCARSMQSQHDTLCGGGTSGVNIGGSSRDATLQATADFIASEECQSVCILTGAGVSVAAGIPDFRSPGGMYATLRPELITATERQRHLMASDPTYVVERSMFFANQFPYLEVRRPFILGIRDQQWKATIAHRFAEQLHQRGKLTRLYTQNIDGLDYQTTVPSDRIVPVHGTLGKVQCEKCGADQDFERFCSAVQQNVRDIYGEDANAPDTSTNILCAKCGSATVKPATVLFGGSLPAEFFSLSEKDLPSCDLLVVAGTSLVVSPANSLVARVPSSTRRIVVNKEPVGMELGLQFAEGGRDSFIGGDCDTSFLELCARLGWLSDLVKHRAALPVASQTALDAVLEAGDASDVCPS